MLWFASMTGGFGLPLALSLTLAVAAGESTSDEGELHARAVRALRGGDAADGRDALRALALADPERYLDQGYAYLAGELAAKDGDDVAAATAFEAVIARRRLLADRAAVSLARLPAIAPARALKAIQGFASRYPASAVMREGRTLEIALLERTGASKAADRALLLMPRGWRREAERELLGVSVDRAARDRTRAVALRLLRTATGDRAAHDAAAALIAIGTDGLAAGDRFELGEALSNHRFYVEAIEVLRPLLDSVHPLRGDATFLAGRSAAKAGDEATARSAYETLVAAGGALAERAAFQLARLDLGCGHEVEAIHRLAALAESASPTRNVAAEAMLKLVRIHAGRRRDDEAIWTLAELERRTGLSSPWSLQAAFTVAAARLASGDPTGALNALAGARANREWDRDLGYWRGRALAALGRYDEAVGVLDRPARGSDLIAALSRAELARLAPAPAGRAAERLAVARAAFGTGDGEAARREATAAVAAGAGFAARQLLCEIDRTLPRDGSVLGAVAKPHQRVMRAAELGHESAASALLLLGFPEEAADELDELPTSRRDPARIFELATLEATSGDFAGSLRHAERLRSRLGLGFRAECLPDDVFSLLYPAAFAPMVEHAVARSGGEVALVRAVMREESRYDPLAHSPAGARGLMQFIPETARLVGHQIGVDVARAHDVHAPELAIPLGARYLANLLSLFDGREAPAVAAYNAGEDIAWEWAARAAGDDTASFLVHIEYAETRAYVDRVLTSLAAYRSRP